MAKYLEKNLSPWAAVSILILAFVVIFAPWQLPMRELYWDESFYATLAMEMNVFPPLSVAHGVAVTNNFPLYPLTASLLNHYGLEMELALRLISVTALLGIALMVFYATRMVTDFTAAIVAVAMLISSNIIIEKTLDGYPNLLMLFFIVGGQLLWFHLGVKRNNWNGAWLWGLAAAAMGFYAGGFSALLFFLFPLIFMRRPLTVWSKLHRSGFYVGLAFIVAMIVFWVLPYWLHPEKIDTAFLWYENLSFKNFIDGFLLFPWDVLMRFAPWTLLVWPAFCVAFHDVSPAPIFSRYLRTLVIANFFLLWIWPFTEPRDIMLLAAPLSILCGINYAILIRRYGKELLIIGRYLSYLLPVVGLTIICFYWVPVEYWNGMLDLQRSIDFKSDSFNILSAYVGVGLCFLSWGILTFKKGLPVWLYFLLIVCAPVIFFRTVALPYRAQETQKYDFAQELRAALKANNVPENEIIYKNDIRDLYGECFYLKYPVKKINSLSMLPSTQETVYLISPEFPQFPGRRWVNLLDDRKTYLNKKIYLWSGELMPQRTYNEW